MNQYKVTEKAKNWVRIVVLPRVERDRHNKRYIFPEGDLYLFSTQHSWYKHLVQPRRFYPLLRIGVEGRGIEAHTPVGDELTWTFYSEDKLLTPTSTVPFSIVENHYLYFSQFLSQYAYRRATMISHHFLNASESERNSVQNRIVRILLEIDPDPPTAQEVYIDFHWDRDIFTREDRTVSIGGKMYTLQWPGLFEQRKVRNESQIVPEKSNRWSWLYALFGWFD